MLVLSLIGLPVYLTIINGYPWTRVLMAGAAPVLVLAGMLIILSAIDELIVSWRDKKRKIKMYDAMDSNLTRKRNNVDSPDWSYRSTVAKYEVCNEDMDAVRDNLRTEIAQREARIGREITLLTELIRFANDNLEMGVLSQYVDDVKEDLDEETSSN